MRSSPPEKLFDARRPRVAITALNGGASYLTYSIRPGIGRLEVWQVFCPHAEELEGSALTYYCKNCEWIAFRESNLLKPGDTNLGCGDTFVMPSSATVCMSVLDNDSSISGGDC